MYNWKKISTFSVERCTNTVGGQNAARAHLPEPSPSLSGYLPPAMNALCLAL